MKFVLFLLSLVAIVLAIVGFTQLLGPVTAHCAQSLSASSSAYQQCVTSEVQHVLTAGGIALLLVGGSALLDVIVWVLGLVASARQRRWGWFIAIFLLAPLTTLLYGVFGPGGAKSGRAGNANANTPGFEALPTNVRPGLCWQCGGRVKLDSRICLNCGATQANYEVGPSAATQASGYDRDNTAGAFTGAPQAAPATGMGWTPPPGYQQPGQPPAMVPDYQQQPGYPPAGYPPPGFQPPGQPPAPGGSGWGQRY